MSSNNISGPPAVTRQSSGQPTVKYHRDFYYLGKCILRLGICILIVTLAVKLAFGSVSPIVLIVLSVVSIVLVILGIIRIAFSYNALKNNQISNRSGGPPEVSTISNFQAFIRNYGNNQQNSSQTGNQSPAENIHCGNRSFGSPSLVSPPSYEPPPSYEQIQKDIKHFDTLEVKT